jgi:hypothetical protein
VDRQGDNLGLPENPPEVVLCGFGSKRVSFVQMILSVRTYSVKPAGFLLVALFALSLVWCPDAACQTEDGDDQCNSLVCALLAKPEIAPGSNWQSLDGMRLHLPRADGLWVGIGRSVFSNCSGLPIRFPHTHPCISAPLNRPASESVSTSVFLPPISRGSLVHRF